MTIVKNKTFVIVPILSFLISFMVNIYVLNHSFPAEDALILWKYVENFVSGKGIVYFAGGPHAEGATDFLWFLLLSALVYIGLDVAIAAALLNAVGAAMLTAVILNFHKLNILKSKPNNQKSNNNIPWWIIFSSLAISLTPPAVASYVGFNVMPYSALCLLLVYFTIKDNHKTNLLIPILGLIITLLRPEGAVFGIGFWLIGLIKSKKYKSIKNYLFLTFLCGLCGAFYFIWRYNYFGRFFPLPFYVKRDGSYNRSNQGILAIYFPWLTQYAYHVGIKSFYLKWFRLPKGGFPIFLVTVISGIVIRKKIGKFSWTFKASLLPFVFWFISLMFVVQSQNIYWRYQSPLYFLTYCLLTLFVFILINHNKWIKYKNVVVFIFIISLIPNLWFGQKSIRSIQRSYVCNFSISIGKILPANTKFALTEAGNLAYWGKYKIYDLIGLNDPYLAVNRVNVAYLRKLDPEIIEVDISPLFYNKREVFLSKCSELIQQNGPLIKVDKEFFEKIIDDEFKPYFYKGVVSYEELKPQRGLLTGIIISHFLVNNLQQYEIYAVKNSTLQLYAIKKNFAFKDTIFSMLKEALETPQFLSYIQAKEIM